MALWLNTLTALLHAVRRNTYTGPSLYGFHIWSHVIMLCAKPKVFVTVVISRWQMTKQPQKEELMPAGTIKASEKELLNQEIDK